MAGPWTFDRGYPFLLVSIRKPSAEAAVAKAVRSAVPDGTPVRVRTLEETPYLRYGDAVLPQMIIKDVFGEFALRPSETGFEVDQGWRGKNIVTADVPILGSVVCHRAIVAQLRDALGAVAQAGLSRSIDPADYGGCFSPRFIGGTTTGRLSHHSWGIAIDVDVGENAFGTKADQDPRVVEILERHGFTWGGRWLIPDGMHFEWVRFP